MRLPWFCFALAMLFVVPGHLSAHPHMWIRGELIPELGHRGLESIRVIWDIDELTSSSLILDYDVDRDGHLDDDEIDTLRRDSFEHLFEMEYYLLIEVGNLQATPARARNFHARIDTGRLIYDFQAPLEVPIRWDDVEEMRIFFFDQSYFIDFRPENIAGHSVQYRDTNVTFRKTRRRSMTMGYGMIELSGIEVASVQQK